LDSGQVKVLIIEDYPDMRALLCLILKSSGYLPIVASHGKEGVEKAISEKPKLILMDIRMPIMDGLEAARALRAHPESKEIPILVTTALLRHPDHAACLEAGCSDYMVRPFNVLDLQNKIRELLTGQ
jgi:CheY-like chemotaxis protein